MAIYMNVDAALTEVPVNGAALVDDTDFKTREESVVYNQAGLDLVWNFVTSAGAMTQTAVVPTTAGVHDWTNEGNGLYAIEIPASGGTIDNDTEGTGWFTGYATGILPWKGPEIIFRAAGINNLLIDSAYSATRGLSGTALPDAVADAAGGLPISDTGGLDLDGMNTNISSVLNDTGTSGVIVTTNNDKTGYALSSTGIDSILDEPITEPSATFTWAGATLRTIIGWLGAKSRNKMTQTSTTTTLRDDADGADISTSTVSDDGTTTTRGEFS